MKPGDLVFVSGIYNKERGIVYLHKLNRAIITPYIYSQATTSQYGACGDLARGGTHVFGCSLAETLCGGP